VERQRQDKTSAQHVAHERKKQRIAGKHRDQQGDEDRRREHDIRRETENPGTLVGNHFVLVEEFPDVPVRLEQTWPALGLDNILEAIDGSRQQGRKAHDDGHLQQVVNDPSQHLRPKNKNSSYLQEVGAISPGLPGLLTVAPHHRSKMISYLIHLSFCKRNLPSDVLRFLTAVCDCRLWPFPEKTKQYRPNRVAAFELD